MKKTLYETFLMIAAIVAIFALVLTLTSCAESPHPKVTIILPAPKTMCAEKIADIVHIYECGGDK